MRSIDDHSFLCAINFCRIVGFLGDSDPAATTSTAATASPRSSRSARDNLDASSSSVQQPPNDDDKNERHKVELVWSVRSGKTKVVWDGSDITHLFSPEATKDRYETVDVSWQADVGPSTQGANATTATATGTSKVQVRIVAHVDSVTDLMRRPQYDLRLNGKSYRCLPTRDELRELAFVHSRSRRNRGSRTRSSAAPTPAEQSEPQAGVETSVVVTPVPAGLDDESATHDDRPEVQSDEGAAAPEVAALVAADESLEVTLRLEDLSSLGSHATGAGAGDDDDVVEAMITTQGGGGNDNDDRDEKLHRHVGGDVDELSDLGCGEEDEAEIESNGTGAVNLVGNEDDDDEKEESYCVTPAASTDFDFRLSMVGLKSAHSNSEHSSTDGAAAAAALVVDELRSDLYSPMLETLRLRITDHLPQLEDVVSKAIIRAFFVDNESSQYSCSGASFSPPRHVPVQIQPDLQGSSSSGSTFASAHNNNTSNISTHPCRRSTTVQLEMDSIKAAHEFVTALSHVAGNGEDAECRSDDDDDETSLDRRLDFMQAQIDAIFCLVRNDDIVPSQAARILLRVACVLGLEFDRPIPTNTVLLTNLDGTATARDVSKALAAFGEVVVTAVAPGGYGLGRFRDSTAAFRAEASRDSLLVKGHAPCVTVLSSSVASASGQEPAEISQLDETGHSGAADEDLRTDSPPSVVARPESPPVTIPHLMALGDFSISFVASSGAAMSSSASSMMMAAAPNKPRPISEAATSSGSSSTQATLAMTESSVSVFQPR
jgi:hypothetical protein